MIFSRAVPLVAVVLAGVVALSAAQKHGMDGDHGNKGGPSYIPKNRRGDRIHHGSDDINTDAGRCATNFQKLLKDDRYVQFTEANEGCLSGNCDKSLRSLQDACDAVDGNMCYEAFTATLPGNASSPDADLQVAQTRKWRSYKCVPRHCPDIEPEMAGVHLEFKGYEHVQTSKWCHNWRTQDEVRGGDGLVHLFGFIAAVVVASYEKRRRFSRMNGNWPAVGTGRRGNGQLRTGLCDCWSACSGRCCKSVCCPCVMATFNRAELDDRQFNYQDLCCANGTMSTIYYNRLSIRERLDAKAEPCCDCLTACCCMLCAVHQHSEELEKGLPPHLPAGAATTAASGSTVVTVAQPHQVVAAGMPVQSYAHGGYQMSPMTTTPPVTAAPVTAAPAGYDMAPVRN